jgi:hypothetical protein
MGKKEGIRRLRPERELLLRSGASYKVTSNATVLYNCIAYAAGDESRWWEPYRRDDRPTYWPKNAIQGYSLEALVSAFVAIGYEACENGDLEPGFEKVALYVADDDTYGHAAKQKDDGSWVSKLGDWEDIRHGTVDVFRHANYGTVAKYMKRRHRRSPDAEEKTAAQ